MKISIPEKSKEISDSDNIEEGQPKKISNKWSHKEVITGVFRITAATSMAILFILGPMIVLSPTRTSSDQRFKPLFINKRFALNKMFQQNASKFAIFYVQENTCSFFRFSFRATVYFYLMNALVYVDIDNDIH